MRITYWNGQAVEAVLLSRHSDKLRVAIVGADDAVVFSNINGTWVSDDCEPVRIEFAWDRQVPNEPGSLEDYICPPELAARLIHLLYTDSAEDEGAAAALPDADGSITAIATQ